MTKIIATIGPSSDSLEIISDMIDKGMEWARINFSHSNKRLHLERFERLKRASQSMGKKIKIFADLQGPKIRIGKILGDKIFLKDNSIFSLSTKPKNTSKSVSIDMPDFYRYVSKGDKIFIDDGKIEFVVEKIKDESVVCRVLRGGWLYSRKGVSILNKEIHLNPITKKDIEDIKFAVSVGFRDFAQSFVRRGSDVEELRRCLNSVKKDKYFIIAKIEDRVGFENIDNIIKKADAVMVARGDLGVSVNRSLVPLIQKEIVEKCNKAGVIDIVATQMLDSMIENPYPTRAEVNDVAVAVMQGVDYVMLSAETAVGKYPVGAVMEMRKIIETVEIYLRDRKIIFE